MKYAMAATNLNSNDAIKTASIEKHLSDFLECVKELKISFDNTQVPVNDDNVTFHRMCEKLEFLLHVGLKESSSFMFGWARTPWMYFKACLTAETNKKHDGIRFVRGVCELKTPSGKLRSFLRFCLVHQCLADTLQQCIMKDDITTQYYSPNSMMLKKNLSSGFITALYELNDIQYDLAPTGYDLDVGWPTFARKQFGSYNWRSPSARLSGGVNSSTLSTQDSESICSLRSGLTSPLSPGGHPLLSSTMAGTISSYSDNSPNESMVECERLIATIRQLTEEKEEAKLQADALVQQKDQELEKERKERQLFESERNEWKDRCAALELRLETAEKQRLSTEELLAEKDHQLATLREELKTAKFDLGSTQLDLDRTRESYTSLLQAFEKQDEVMQLGKKEYEQCQTRIITLRQQSAQYCDQIEALETLCRERDLSIMTRNEECEGLVNELRSVVADSDQLRTQYQQLEAAYQAMKAAEGRLKADNKLLKDESVILRDKIVQLIKEKDCLWQRSDRLLHLQRVKATDQWLADGTIRECQGCHSKFTLFLRRHHCRLCGRIFCHSCSDHWLKIAASSRPERTCQECFAIHRQFSQPDAGQLGQLPASEQDSSAVVADDSQLTEEAVQQRGHSDSEPCAGFSIISDDEIVLSLNESSPYSSSPLRKDGVTKSIRTAELRSFASLLETEENAVATEAFISAATIHRVPLEVAKPDCTLHWKFRPDPKSIAFAVVGCEDGDEADPSAASEENLTRVIVETSLYKAEEDYVEGSATLPLPGLYYVYFDNSFSRFSANKVTFHLGLSLPPA